MLGGWIDDLDGTTGGTTPTGGGSPGTPVQPSLDVAVQTNIVSRLSFLIPQGWFHSALKNAVMTGVANAFTLIYQLLAYLRLQTRISTATDGFLDLIAFDFFANNLQRASNQSDASYRANILSNIIRERGTRKAVISILTQLTGRSPVIFEPERVSDAGTYGGPGLAYGVAGGYGSMLLPFQAFITAYRPLGSGIPNVAGYGIPTGAYSTASQSEYADLSFSQNFLADSDIYSAIASVLPEAVIAWVKLSS